jgi:hypothetical protein
MADMNAVWHGTRTYMMSARTNPDPTSYVSTLRNLGLTSQEKAWLIQQVSSWTGGNPSVVRQTTDDINQARPG